MQYSFILVPPIFTAIGFFIVFFQSKHETGKVDYLNAFIAAIVFGLFSFLALGLIAFLSIEC